MTGREVMAAMMRKVPCCHLGHRFMSMAKTYLSNWVHRQRDEAGLASCSTPGWRGAGVMATRRRLCSTKQPPCRTWCTRGGTDAASDKQNA